MVLPSRVTLIGLTFGTVDRAAFACSILRVKSDALEENEFCPDAEDNEPDAVLEVKAELEAAVLNEDEAEPDEPKAEVAELLEVKDEVVPNAAPVRIAPNDDRAVVEAVLTEDSDPVGLDDESVEPVPNLDDVLFAVNELFEADDSPDTEPEAVFPAAAGRAVEAPNEVLLRPVPDCSLEAEL